MTAITPDQTPDEIALNLQVKLKATCWLNDGAMLLPCIPATIEHGPNLLQRLFAQVGEAMPAADLNQLCQSLADLVAKGQSQTTVSQILVQYGHVQKPKRHFKVALHLVANPYFSVGIISLPTVPALVDETTQIVEETLAALGHVLPTPQLRESLRQGLLATAKDKFAQSPDGRLVVRYQSGLLPDRKFSLNLSGVDGSISDSYQGWLLNREPPLFGKHADAKVLAMAHQLAPGSTILDIGAGTGRNSLPLASLGFVVEATEVVPEFVAQLQAQTTPTGLDLTVRHEDILDPAVSLKPAHYQLAIATEVIASHFRHPDQVRLMLAKLCDGVCSGGFILFNTFLAEVGYEPDLAIRQLAQTLWSYPMTRTELQQALADLPLDLVSDESVYDYELAHLPPEAWPPTEWFGRWSLGQNLFPDHPQPPITLRWLVYQRR